MMNQLEPLQVGVMFWTGGELGVEGTPFEIVQMVKGLGVTCGQLGIDPDADLTAAAVDAWVQALEKQSFTITAVFPAYKGESYADIPTVQRTVGFVRPPPLAKSARNGPTSARTLRTRWASRRSRPISVSSRKTAMIPTTLQYGTWFTDCVTTAVENGQNFGLETGQESATALGNFIRDVDRANLGINFDPANMILYGCGEPLEALEMVKEWVISVHCKDALWPKKKGIWGTEVPLGQGDVGMDRYVAKLRGIGYRGPLSIEREITGEEQRGDIREAIALLERLRGGG